MSFRDHALTQEELKQILHYDPERGIFTWIKSRDGAGCKKGNQADTIKNLREVSVVCNARNTGNRCDTTSGVKGVYKVSKTEKWNSQIVLNGSRKYLDSFDDFDEAVCHRLAAEQCLDWSACDSNSPAFNYVQNKIQGDL